MSLTSIHVHLNDEHYLNVRLDPLSQPNRHYMTVAQHPNDVTIFGSPEQLKQIADAINTYLEGLNAVNGKL